MRFPKTFLVYDFETTGLDTAVCDVIEIGARLVESGTVKAEKSWLVRIPSALPGVITELTGITDELLAAEGVDEGKAFREFASLAGSAEALVGHNILRFDNPILARKAEQHGVGKYFEGPMARSIDTGGLFKARKLGQEQAWHETLGDFCRRVLEERGPVKYNLALAHAELLGTDAGPEIRAHRASGDIHMAHAVYEALTRAA